MIIVYELAALCAAAIAVVLIWHKVQVQRQIRIIDARLARMQKEIEALQVQESRRTMLALKEKVESPGIDPADGTPDVDGDVVRLAGKPRATTVQ